MALIVQNDDGTVASANALISRSFFLNYHAERGVDLGDYEDDATDAAIVQATDYLDARWKFPGAAIGTTAWPRTGAYVAGETVLGIPSAVKRAVAEYGLIRLLGTDLWADPRADETGRIIQSKTEKVGTIEETVAYAGGGGARPRLPSFPIADAILLRAGLVGTTPNLMRA